MRELSISKFFHSQDLNEHYQQVHDRFEEFLPVDRARHAAYVQLDSSLNDLVLTVNDERSYFMSLGDDEYFLAFIDKVEGLFDRHSKFFELLEDED